VKTAGALLSVLLAGQPVLAEGTLIDRVVTFRVMAYDDPAQPIFDGHGATVKVSDTVEFGLYPEGVQNGFDVIPVQVNISARRIEIGYAGNAADIVYPVKFNGYVLSFDTDCVLFDGAHIDPQGTNMAVSDANLNFEGGTLFINVSGVAFDSASRLAVDLGVLDCPLS
jgi:hypothetical protein